MRIETVLVVALLGTAGAVAATAGHGAGGLSDYLLGCAVGVVAVLIALARAPSDADRD